METIDLELTRLFVKVIQHGGFSKAAKHLKIPKSTISKAIARLESMTGTKLLLRSTRNHTLTDAGRAFYERSLGPIQSLEEAQKSLYGSDTIISGRMKITAPEDLGMHVISPAIGELCLQYPELSFELHYSSQRLDLIKDGYDLAIRIGDLQTSQLKAKKAGEIVLVPYASPVYLKKAPRITSPKDLTSHSCLTISEASSSRQWSFKNKREKIVVPVVPRIESNQMTSLIAASAAGVGIVLAPSFACTREVALGKLVRILPDWCGVGVPVHLVSPLSTNTSARLKAVSDFLTEAIKQSLIDL